MANKLCTHRISCKNLGILALPYFCPRCFWFERVLWRGNPPFRFNPPRLMNHLDSFQKNAIIGYAENNNGQLPEWLGPYASAVECREGVKIKWVDDQTGLELVGVPDLEFELPDGSIAIVDCKSADYKEGNDPLLPMYQVQVNAYAFLRRLQGASVKKGAFVYFEGNAGQVADVDPHKSVTDFGHTMAFHAFVHELELQPEQVVRPLLKRVAKIYSMTKPPLGASGCKACEKLGAYRKASAGEAISLADSQNVDLPFPTIFDHFEREDWL